MKKYILVAAMLVLSLFTLPAGDGSRAAGEGSPGTAALEERRDALAGQTDLGESEKELIAELLAWDVKIEDARLEQERLQQEIPVAERSLAEAGTGLAESRVLLDDATDQLGRWVNFLYRYGPVAYLEVVLGAADFNGFVVRAEAVKTVIVSQVKLLEEVRDLTAHREGQVAALEQAQADLAAKNLLLTGKLKEMEDSRAGREEFLAGLRLQSADLAGRIVQSEMLWYRSLTSLHYLLAQLGSLPWSNLSPDKFSFAGKRLRLEFSDGKINRTFFEQGDAKLAGFSVQCAPGRVTISGPAVAGGANYRIDGNFVPLGQGKVRFQPEDILLAGVPVSREVLGFISSESGLTMDFGDYSRGYGLSEVRAEEGRLVVFLAAN